MENSPLFHPTVLVFIVASVVTFTVWLIRTESQISRNKEKIAALEHETAQIWKSIEEHKDREGLHFNQAVARQVEEKQNARFDRIESDIREIKQILREMKQSL